MAQGIKLRSGQCARSAKGDSPLTVPQIRAVLCDLLEATRRDASLDGLVAHLRHAVDAIDDARAIALAVMQEADAERSEQTWAPGASMQRLC